LPLSRLGWQTIPTPGPCLRDGRTLAFCGKRKKLAEGTSYLDSAAEGQGASLAAHPEAGELCEAPTWSPDGKTIACPCAFREKIWAK